MSNTVDLLWTGGWDSTFRVLELLHETDAVIRPHYVVDPERLSNDTEIRTIKRITALLHAQRADAVDRLLPVIVAQLADIPDDEPITQALQSLREHEHVGQQYDWLARYACHVARTDLELTIEKTDHATATLRDHFVDASQRISRYRVEDTGGKIATVFGRFLFPLIDFDKTAMQTHIDQWEMGSIMNETWFCHFPLHGRFACGTCRPCVYVMDKGQPWRIGTRGRIRYTLIERTRRIIPPGVKNGLRKRASARLRRWIRA